MNEQDKLMYSFDLNQFEQDNVYANLPSANSGHRITTGQSHPSNHNRQNGHRYNSNSRNHHNQRQQPNEQDQFEVHHYEPKGPERHETNHLQQQQQQQHQLPPTMHLPSAPTEAELVAIFTDLAESVDVHLPEELTRHILTLIRLGVPPDDIYIFLRDCIDLKRNAT